MTPDPAQRPRQVTLGGGLAAVGGLLLLLGLYDTLGATQSFELRRQLAETLAQPPASGLGIGVEQALSAMRVLITVAAVAAGLAVVLGVFTVLGDNRARWGLLACAIVVFVASPVAGAGLLGLGVTLGTILVFSGQGRDWFAGRPIREVTPAGRATRSGERSGDRSGERPGGTSDERPRQGSGRGAEARPGGQSQRRSGSGRAGAGPYGSTGSTGSVFASRGAPGGAPEAGGDPFDAPSPSSGAERRRAEPDRQGAPRGATDRPRPVGEACVATWIGSLVAVMICLVLLLFGIFARSVAESQFAAQPELETLGLSASAVVDGMIAAAALGVAWAVAAALLAVGAWRGVATTQVLLLVSAVVTVVVALLAFPLGLVNAALAGFVVVKLLRAESRAWLSR